MESIVSILAWLVDRSLSIRLGDADNDGMSDSIEHAQGTDWSDAQNFCCNFAVTYTGVFQTTNALTFAALWGTNTVWGPTPVADRAWTCGFGHRVSTHAERPSVNVWDDANHNGEWDEGETGDRYTFRPTSHEVCVTNELPYGKFDRDGGGLLDWWEAVHNLSVADKYGDADGDGMINLHEYWMGSDPHDSSDKGEGTALYAAVHGIDDRILGKTASTTLLNFTNYSRTVLPETLDVNPDFWCADVDLSCVSIWNDSPTYQYGDQQTLLSPQHVIEALHVHSPIGRTYTFMDANGNRVERTLLATQSIEHTDIQVGLLSAPLPSSYLVAKLLPDNYRDYLGSLDHVPIMHRDQERKSFVQELPTLPEFNRRDMEIKCNRGSTLTRLSFYESVVLHDSGSPCFLLLGDNKIFLYAVHARQPNNYNASEGYHTMLFRQEIQHTMDVLSAQHGFGTFSLSTFDLSNYNPLERR